MCGEKEARSKEGDRGTRMKDFRLRKMKEDIERQKKGRIQGGPDCSCKRQSSHKERRGIEKRTKKSGWRKGGRNEEGNLAPTGEVLTEEFGWKKEGSSSERRKVEPP